MNTKTAIGAPPGVELTAEASAMRIYCVGVIDNYVVRSIECAGLRPMFYTEAEAAAARDAARLQGHPAEIVEMSIANAVVLE